MYKPCLRVFCHCCSPPLTLIDILSSSKVFVVTKWTMWKSRKNSKAKERNLELETSFPQLGKPTFPLALPGTLSPDSPKRLPSSPCSPFSSHGHHRCTPGIPSVPRVPAAVFKNQEAPFLPGCRQTLHVPAALSPALRLPGFMPAGAYTGSAKTSITERARHLGHTARLPRSGQLVPTLGRWIRIVTNSSQLTLFLRGIMVLSIFWNLTRNWFPGS